MERAKEWGIYMDAIQQLRDALEDMREYNTAQVKKDTDNWPIARRCNDRLFDMILALDRIEDALTDTESYTV